MAPHFIFGKWVRLKTCIISILFVIGKRYIPSFSNSFIKPPFMQQETEVTNRNLQKNTNYPRKPSYEAIGFHTLFNRL